MPIEHQKPFAVYVSFENEHGHRGEHTVYLKEDESVDDCLARVRLKCTEFHGRENVYVWIESHKVLYR